MVEGQEVLVTGVLATQGSRAVPTIENLSPLFKGFGAAAVAIEQIAEGWSNVQSGASIGTTALGAGANTTVVVGSGIVADTLIGAGIGTATGIPIVGTVAGAAGGLVVGGLVQAGLPGPSKTGQAIQDSLSRKYPGLDGLHG